MSELKNEKILDLEAKGCFDFFWNEVNTDKTTTGYGMILDTTKVKNRASIASVGFGLSAIIIGVKRGWITYEQGYERTLGTLITLRDHVSQFNGFFAHFVDMTTGKRLYNCEYSTIDTALLLTGAITSAEFFEGEIKKIVDVLLKRVNWKWLVTETKNRLVFRMSFNPDKNIETDGWSKAIWGLYSEQLMMYFLAAGQEGFDPELARKLYFGFERRVGSYKTKNFVYNFSGKLFIYQFSHAWIDFRNIRDAHGFDWFENSVEATLANRNWCIDHMHLSKTYHENSWGLTASDGPTGYKGYGTGPNGWENVHLEPKHDGTVPPCGPAGSVPFEPKICIESLNYFYEHHPKLWGEYGFKDAYNIDCDWYSEMVIGIDKGISLLMIDNYQNGTTWDYFMQSETMKKACDVLGFKEC